MNALLIALATGGIPSFVWVVIAVLVIIALIIFIVNRNGHRGV